MPHFDTGFFDTTQDGTNRSVARADVAELSAAITPAVEKEADHHLVVVSTKKVLSTTQFKQMFYSRGDDYFQIANVYECPDSGQSVLDSVWGIAHNHMDGQRAGGNNGSHPVSRSGPASTWEPHGRNLEYPRFRTTWHDSALCTISLSSDGLTLAVGEPHHKVGTCENCGRVRIYRWNGSDWPATPTIELTLNTTISNASNAGTWPTYSGAAHTQGTSTNAWAGPMFGWSVSLSSDGSRIAVGAPYWERQEVNPAAGTVAVGIVEVFDLDFANNSSTLMTKFEPETVAPGVTNPPMGTQRCGWSVSLSGDGERFAAGMPKWNQETGRVAVIKVVGLGSSTWGGEVEHDQYVSAAVDWPARLKGIETNEAFGRSVSLNKNGLILAVGAPLWNDAAGAPNSFLWDVGRVRVLHAPVTPGTTGAWDGAGTDVDIYGHNEVPENIGESRFGYSVSLDDNGTTLAIGAPRWGTDFANPSGPNDEPARGRAYVYDVGGSGATKLLEKVGEAQQEWFGVAVSVSADGYVVAIGAHKYDHSSGGSNEGKVQVYMKVGPNFGEWEQHGDKIVGIVGDDTPPEDQTEIGFGRSVSLNENGSLLAGHAPRKVGHVANTDGSWDDGYTQVYRLLHVNDCLKSWDAEKYDQRVYNFNKLGGRTNDPKGTQWAYSYVHDNSRNMYAQFEVMGNLEKDTCVKRDQWTTCSRMSIEDQLYGLAFASETDQDVCMKVDCARRWSEVEDALAESCLAAGHKIDKNQHVDLYINVRVTNSNPKALDTIFRIRFTVKYRSHYPSIRSQWNTSATHAASGVIQKGVVLDAPEGGKKQTEDSTVLN